MKLTMGQAAKESGISKATLSRAIKSGRLSAVPNDRNGFDIDPAELFRAFPRNTGNGSGNSAVKQSVTSPVTGDETGALQAQIEGLREILRRADLAADELKADRDHWRQQAERLALTGPGMTESRPWWRRVVGG
jgi:hypothetical protein